MSYKNFGPTDLVDEGIAAGDYAKVRRALANCCEFDRAFSKHCLRDGIEYITQKGVSAKVFEPFDVSCNPLYGRRVDEKDPTLKKNDFSDSLFYLAENFCRERVDDTEKLGRYLFPNERVAQKPAATAHEGARPANTTAKTASSAASKAGGKPANPLKARSQGGSGKSVWPLVLAGGLVIAALIWLMLK